MCAALINASNPGGKTVSAGGFSGGHSFSGLAGRDTSYCVLAVALAFAAGDLAAVVGDPSSVAVFEVKVEAGFCCFLSWAFAFFAFLFAVLVIGVGSVTVIAGSLRVSATDVLEKLFSFDCGSEGAWSLGLSSLDVAAASGDGLLDGLRLEESRNSGIGNGCGLFNAVLRSLRKVARSAAELERY